MSDERNYLMDNIKALLLFLVALGHTLDVYKANGGLELYLMKYLYLFHMPMFAFITGYFTKNLDKARNTAVERCLVPYLIFQGIYVIMATLMIRIGLANFNSASFNSSIIVPSSAFYYLLAVFFWKLFAKDIMRTRVPMILSILMGLVISITKMEEFHIGYGAVFSLLPFFVLGILCSSDIVEKIRKIPKVIAIFALVIGIWPAVMLPYGIHSVRMTYEAAGFNDLQGVLYRILFYVIAIVLGTAIICLMSSQKTFFSHVGRASILVYAGSTFLAPHAYLILDKMWSLSEHRYLNILGIIVFCIIIIFICSIPIFLQWYNQIIGGINKLIFEKVSRKNV
ncbi:acyltransferase family protein [Claveliimonas bilis]|uniref:acyltransferase family protein n=1 Tax=Claveliimonas bilis TaxID=3028070 RepID=UPI0029314BBA|nr:acyltransferase family protein [Claveliimonas bilis]BDZ79026.1 putative membrane-bound acyltransferase YkrP [Claveliimonas bilis]